MTNAANRITSRVQQSEMLKPFPRKSGCAMMLLAMSGYVARICGHGVGERPPRVAQQFRERLVAVQPGRGDGHGEVERVQPDGEEDEILLGVQDGGHPLGERVTRAIHGGSIPRGRKRRPPDRRIMGS